jgi:hypothetical protein
MLYCVFGLREYLTGKWCDPLTHTYSNIYREVNTSLQRVNEVVFKNVVHGTFLSCCCKLEGISVILDIFNILQALFI